MDIESIKTEYAQKEIKAELYRLSNRIVELKTSILRYELAKSFDLESGDVFVMGEDGEETTQQLAALSELELIVIKFENLKNILKSLQNEENSGSFA